MADNKINREKHKEKLLLVARGLLENKSSEEIIKEIAISPRTYQDYICNDQRLDKAKLLGELRTMVNTDGSSEEKSAILILCTSLLKQFKVDHSASVFVD